MHNSTTHYQTSFRVKDDDGDAMMRVKAAVYGWVAKKEGDRALKTDKGGFFFRCKWSNLFKTHSDIVTDSFLSDTSPAWAMQYTEIDKDFGRKRFWISDVGAKKVADAVVVSVRVSFAWNSENLSHEQEAPQPSVPAVVRYILKGNHVYSGRPDFLLLEKPIFFNKPGMGKGLCSFIQSAERRYPLVVFNGDSFMQVEEAKELARELTGKSLVAVVADDEELAEEIRVYLPPEYRIPFWQYRVFFPFNQKGNSPVRHRWYDISSEGYPEQRHGVVNGLLRNHSLIDPDAVENIVEIRRLVARDELMKLKVESPDQQKQLSEFLDEHSRVAAERDGYKHESALYASEIDRLENEVRRLEWLCKDYQSRLDAEAEAEDVDHSKLMPRLPSNLGELAKIAKGFFAKLVITDRAIQAAQDYSNCKSIVEAWEMLGHLNTELHRLKFKDGQKNLERAFKDQTGYELAMSEGRNTKRDKELMNLRELRHDGREYDITPHLKHQTSEPKLLRIYFAFDEERKKIVIGHIGRHLPNATTKTM